MCMAWLSHVPPYLLVPVLCKTPAKSYIWRGGGVMHMFILRYVFKLILLLINNELNVIAIANIY